jgi:hypothetical protein
MSGTLRSGELQASRSRCGLSWLQKNSGYQGMVLKVFLLIEKFIKAWSVWTGKFVSEVELDHESYLDLFPMDGSKIGLHFTKSLTLGWDFGISGSSPVPLPSSERPHLDFIGGASWWYDGLCWVEDTVTGQEVFRLSGRYATPWDVQWDGQYLIVGYRSGEILILDFDQALPQ